MPGREGAKIGPVILFRRRQPAPPAEPERPSFGEWLIRQFTGGEPASALSFQRLERVCSNAGLLLCGAAYARPEAFRESAPRLNRREAGVVARRTADGFKASLGDRANTVLAWPWDHMATSIAWTGTREGDVSEARLGRALTEIGTAYALVHREQLAAVVDLWQQVAAGLNGDAPPPDMLAMGSDMLRAFEAAMEAPGT